MPSTRSRTRSRTTCPRPTQRVDGYHRRDPRTGRRQPVSGYHRRIPTFRERLAHASGGASEHLPVVAAGTAAAAATCAATAATVVTVGVQAALGVAIACTIIGYQAVARWARGRGVEMPPLHLPASWTGEQEIDARKVEARARRRERARTEWTRLAQWGRTRPAVVRRAVEWHTLQLVRVAGVLYRAARRVWDARRSAVAGREES